MSKKMNENAETSRPATVDNTPTVNEDGSWNMDVPDPIIDWQTGGITPGPMLLGAERDPVAIARHRAALRNRAEAKRQHPDTTIPGGFYLLADGSAVDANGNPVNRSPADVHAELAVTRAALPPRP